MAALANDMCQHVNKCACVCARMCVCLDSVVVGLYLQCMSFVTVSFWLSALLFLNVIGWGVFLGWGLD